MDHLDACIVKQTHAEIYSRHRVGRALCRGEVRSNVLASYKGKKVSLNVHHFSLHICAEKIIFS
jgi:hypothetical protein